MGLILHQYMYSIHASLAISLVMIDTTVHIVNHAYNPVKLIIN